jgi:sulfane dehydrogenase subunit SoxC
LHFIECAGNRHNGKQKNVQDTHGMTSCSEWTGVLLSTLLKECGLKGSAKWFVAEGAEEVKGASSIPIEKGMDDCIIEDKELALGEQIGPKSVITYPSGTQRLPGPGFYEISGLAWSGGGAVKTVEVSTDGGKKWNRAEFKNTPQRMAHVRFAYPWKWDGTETEILSRCTDEIGQRQAMREEIANWWKVPFERDYRVPGLDNSVMPWKIARDGSVTNGLA